MQMLVTAQQLEQQMPDATQLLSDEPEMESSKHYMQLLLLVTSLEWLWREREDFFIGANLTIYFSRQQLRNKEFRGPDFFLVKETEKKTRNSWVVWEEDGRYPDLIIELLSESTANVDRKVKKNLYQNRFRTPEYFWFSPADLEFVGFKLVRNTYQEIVPNAQGWLWSQVLELYLGVLSGKLRYFTSNGDLVPTPEEAALALQQQAQAAQQQAQAAQQQAQTAKAEAQTAKAEASEAQLLLQQEQQRVAQLTEQLRSLGIDPNNLT